MRDYFLPMAALLCVLLAGCAGLPIPGHSDNRNIAAHEKIATDTVNQLAKLYPPAKTELNLVLSNPRSFGRCLPRSCAAAATPFRKAPTKPSSFPLTHSAPHSSRNQAQMNRTQRLLKPHLARQGPSSFATPWAIPGQIRCCASRSRSGAHTWRALIFPIRGVLPPRAPGHSGSTR